MKTVNHYVAWMEYKGDRSVRYQGFAESEDEFKTMCENNSYDLSSVDGVECVRENARNEIGRPCEKKVTEY